MSAMTTPEYLMANAKNHGNDTGITSKGSNGNLNDVSGSVFHDRTASVAESHIAM